MTYFMENGLPEPKSATSGAWDKIHNTPRSKKKIKSGQWHSVTFRYAEEKPRMSAKTMARKRASAEKIQKILNAKKRYEYLLEHENASVSYPKGVPTVFIRGEKGKFTGEKVTFN